MLLDIAHMCIKAKNILPSGCAMYRVSTVDQTNFNLIFYNFSPDGPNTGNYVTCSVTKLLISTYIVMGLLAKT